jgi:hypothetical protein
MPIANYSTSISAAKTIGEIMEILVEHGAEKITCDYERDTKIPTSVTFGLESPTGYKVYFELPANYEGCLKAMLKDRKIPRSACTKDQAVRVAWRTLKDWIRAQCAINEAGLASMDEVFFAYAITARGSTLYKDVNENDTKLLLK